MCSVCAASGAVPASALPGGDITALSRQGVGSGEPRAALLGRALPCCAPLRTNGNCLDFHLFNALAAMKTSVCQSKSEKCFEELHKVACDKSSMPFSESDELKRTLQAQSQILGWCVIVTTALLSLLTTCCASCQSKVSHLQLMFWRVYEGTEKEQLEQIFQLYATKLSERNLKCFFENKEPEPISLPAFQAWEDASQLYSFSSSKQHYSMIHRLVEEGQKGINEERETMLDLADRREIP
ncbi:calcium homeostasis modulator protein 5-like isoform X2 [Corvus moneduloides]|uniref:calcium homeostasis modulator protein 5-like isoform X2 n=1 Tax=Corvus moneduloides TaxID=1196302 RepID=UPI00136471BE|nr:calcium homeostasis modulator protein 5-like isoform X2 [Corvus moneduloides]